MGNLGFRSGEALPPPPGRKGKPGILFVFPHLRRESRWAVGNQDIKSGKALPPGGNSGGNLFSALHLFSSWESRRDIADRCIQSGEDLPPPRPVESEGKIGGFFHLFLFMSWKT